MSEIVSRRDFLKVAVVGTGTAITQACAPEPLKPSNIIPSLTPIPLEPTKTLEPTSEPFPPIEAKEWAEKENGSINAEKLFPYVGDWILTTPSGEKLASSKNRAVDLLWEGMRLVYVGDQDVQAEGFDQNAYRIHVAEQTNNQIELKRKLSEIKEALPGQDLVPALMTIVIDGPAFSNITANLVMRATGSNSVITGIAVNVGSFPRWFKYEGQELSRMRNDEYPMLLPPIRSEGGRAIRADTGEEEMMRGINFGEFRLELGWEVSAFKLGQKFQELKDAGGNFLVVQFDRNYFYSPGFYGKLGEALGMARNKFGFRIMLSLGWDKSIPNEMIRVPDQQLVDDWRRFVNFKDDSSPYMDRGQSFASILRRTVDFYQMLTEPSGDFTYFNQYLDGACAEIKSAVGPEAICGFSDGDFWATDAVELLYVDESGADLAKKFSELHPNSAVVIHPFKLDNPVDPNDPLRSERPDPMLYVKQLKDKGVLVIIGEAGWEDWKMNKDWLMSFFQYCEDNKIPYAIDGDVSDVEHLWSQYKNAT